MLTQCHFWSKTKVACFTVKILFTISRHIWYIWMFFQHMRFHLNIFFERLTTLKTFQTLPLICVDMPYYEENNSLSLVITICTLFYILFCDEGCPKKNEATQTNKLCSAQQAQQDHHWSLYDLLMMRKCGNVSQWTQNELRILKIHHGVSDHLKVSSE